MRIAHLIDFLAALFIKTGYPFAKILNKLIPFDDGTGNDVEMVLLVYGSFIIGVVFWVGCVSGIVVVLR